MNAPKGYYTIREYTMWGKCSVAREDTPEKPRVRFESSDHDRWLTPVEMLAELMERWRPVARDEVDYFCNTMRRELMDLQERE